MRRVATKTRGFSNRTAQIRSEDSDGPQTMTYTRIHPLLDPSHPLEEEDGHLKEQEVIFFNDRAEMVRNRAHSWDSQKGWRALKNSTKNGA